jgi:hypothetical protein
MKNLSIAVLALRLMAIYVLTIYVTMVGMVGFYGSDMGHSGWPLMLFITLAYLGLAGFLFTFAPGMAKHMVAGSPDSTVDLQGQISSDSETLIYQLVGVLLLASAVPDIIQALVLAAYPLFLPGDSATPFEYIGANWRYLIAPAVKLLIGIVLILRARGLQALMRKLRPMSGG